MEALSYRPRNAGHDYYGRGTYLITLVVSGREQLLSRLVTDAGRSVPAPLALTPLGEVVQEAWLQIPVRSLSHGNKVVVLLMKNECLERGYPLIHLQASPIGRYWKPELKRFEACHRGSLLILAPWNLDAMGIVGHVPSDTDYSRIHNLNTLAAEICAFIGEAKIMR